MRLMPFAFQPQGSRPLLIKSFPTSCSYPTTTGAQTSSPLPAGLGNAWHQTLKGKKPEADSAHTELPHIATGPSAQTTAVVRPDLELRLTLLLYDHAGFRHVYLLLLLGERHAEVFQQSPSFIICWCACANNNIHPVDDLDLVVIYLRENKLFLDTHGVITMTVERLG